jgi:hypothetical protein
MPAESSNGFSARHRLVLAIAGALATVVLLVMVYRLTAPKATTVGGGRVAEGDLLQVGALPVT